MTPTEQHAYDARRLAEIAASASPDDWSAPSPVRGWTARDVLRHLVDWLPGFVERAGVNLAPVSVDADPVAAWRRRSADVAAMLEQHGDDRFESPMVGTMSLGQAVAQFYVKDVWMHSWDLARALGRDVDLGEERCAEALVAMAPMDDLLRESGQFGPKVAVSSDASPQDRLVAFIGRDPAWRPGA